MERIKIITCKFGCGTFLFFWGGGGGGEGGKGIKRKENLFKKNNKLVSFSTLFITERLKTGRRTRKKVNKISFLYYGRCF